MGRNDNLLVLDEFSQVPPGHITNIIYAAANGRGRERFGQLTATWTNLILSSGEVPLDVKLRAARVQRLAGLGVRFIDVRADVGVHGAFDDLHGAPSGREFSDILRDNACHTYGAVGKGVH